MDDIEKLIDVLVNMVAKDEMTSECAAKIDALFIAPLRAEIETLKAQLHRAELAAEGWKPASEPPDDSRDVILRFPDLSEAEGWYSLVIVSWVLTQVGLDVYLDTPDAVRPVAWKELE